MTVILDSESLAYLDTIKEDDPTKYQTAADKAEADIQAAMNSGNPIDGEEVKFYVDFYQQLGPSGLQHVSDWLYGTSDTGGVLGNGTHLTGGAYASFVHRGHPITDALAPLLANPQFSASSVGGPQATWSLVIAALQNAPTQPVPAYVMQELGQWPASPVHSVKFDVAFDVATLGGTTGAPMATATVQAQTEAWFTYAANNNQAIDPALLQAYIQCDPEHATTALAGIVQSTMTPDGSVDQQLMDALRSLNPTGPDGPTVDASVYTDAQTYGFDASPPVVSGWAAVALDALLANIANDKPLNPTLLKQLQATSPWAANYAQWKALQSQLANNQNLDESYLQSLAQFNPTLAAQIANAALGEDTGGGPQLTLANNDGIDPANNLINHAPKIKINLASWPQAASVGSTITLYQGATTTAPVAVTHVLTALDVQQGYITVTAPAVNGITAYTATVTDATTGLESAKTAPLTVEVQTAGPQITGAWLDEADPTTIYLKVSDLAGLQAANLPDAYPFFTFTLPPFAKDLNGNVVATDNSSISYGDVEIDAVHGLVKISGGNWAGIDGASAALSFGGISVQYNPNPLGWYPAMGPGLVDRFGNKAAPTTFKIQITGPAPAFTPGALPPPVPPAPVPAALVPRAMDWSAYDVLMTVNPALATAWKAAFDARNMVGPAPPLPPGAPPRPTPAPTAAPAPAPLTAAQILALDLKTALMKVYTDRANTLESELQDQMVQVNNSNQALGNLNNLLAALNALQAKLPANAPITDPMAKYDSNDADYQPARDGVIASLLTGSEPFKSIPNSTASPAPPNYYVNGNLTVSQLSSAISTVRGCIDSMSNNQQSDMLRLQSLTTAYNQCFEIMTNFLEKVANVTDGVIANMK